MKKYINYVENLQCNNIEEVKNWVSKNLFNYLQSNQEEQDDIEHILDYLCSDKAPKRLLKMSYAEAKTGSEKWLKALLKNGKPVIETEEIMGLVTPLQNVNMDTFWDEVHSTWSKFNDDGLTEDYAIEDFVDFHNENSVLKIDSIVTDFIQL